jgi:hypothetical protein
MDAAGHCGRWSPVATARPCTFDVPAPATALAVSAGNCTGSFTVMFTRSPTPNLQGHIVRVYRGLQAAGVPERQLLITGAFASINGLVRFRDYTFTVTPLTWCNVEGPPTAPVTRSSDCALALDPPAFILDLHAARAGSAIRLDWGAITRTVTGTAANIVGYVVYRAAVPGFVADPSTEIARPAGLTLVDPARVGNGIAVEFYAVAAVDSAGRRGGVGHDFPQGVTAFKNDLGSDWEITWTPVPYDIQGDETPVAAYEVYTATGPLTRARIEAEGLLPRVVVAAGPVTVPEIPGEDAVFVVPRDVHGNRSVN